jgi:prepilin signal peptidase PulO-like enzyme (type II secretory pathway)
MVLIALIFALAAVMILIWLSIIDLKIFLLPNKLVAAFALCGIAFHMALFFELLSPHEIVFGGLMGFWCLYIISMIANWAYGQDALGLGDVKLLGAGGLWLGVDGILLGMSIGALFGLLHGLVIAVHRAQTTNTKLNLTMLQIPAGPGFAAGLVCVGVYLFHDIIWLL